MPHALIIDDQFSNVSVLGMLLENEGITYSAVTNPITLDETLASEPQPDIVFLDLELPGATGIDLLPSLREVPTLAGVPIVAYTVHTSEIDLARRAGFDGFLGKPLDALNFRDQISRLLNGEAVWAS